MCGEWVRPCEYAEASSIFRSRWKETNWHAPTFDASALDEAKLFKPGLWATFFRLSELNPHLCKLQSLIRYVNSIF